MRADLKRLKRETDTRRSAATSAVEEDGADVVGSAPSSSKHKTASSWKQPASEPTQSGWSKLRISAAVVVVAAAIAGGLYLRSRQTQRLGEKDTIVLADFANTTGDTVFDDTLKQALAIQLEQSPFLNVLPEERVNATLKLMNRGGNVRVTREVAKEICQRINGKALLAGSVANVGSQYLVGLQAVNCQTGDSLAAAQAEAENRDKVLKALEEAGNKLREKLGESLASVQKFNKPLDAATTSSLEALKAYTLGQRTKQEKGDVEALPLYKRAVELDANFARAYASLGTAYSNLGQASLAIANYKKSYELRDRVSERERFYIESNYYASVTGELDKANQIYAQWIQTYPGDDTPHLDLGDNYAYMGQHEKAVAETREYVRLSPEDVIGYGNLVSFYLPLNRLDEAKTAFDQAQALKLDSPYLHEAHYQLAFLQNDNAAMQQEVAWATGKPGSEDILLSAQSDTEASSGQLARARDLSQRAVESAKRNDARETAAVWQVNAALRETEFGNAAKARQAATAALVLAPGRDVEVLAALALAAGDTAQAQRLAETINQQSPRDQMIQGYWLPAIRAAVELSRGNAQRAIESLDLTSAYELAAPLPFQLGTMYPAYLRGLAYLKAGQGKQAVVEFQKIVDHRGLVQNFPLGTLSHLGLAHAYALSGDTSKARTAYQDFFALWKNADPDIPILKEAKAEFEKLK